MVPTKTYSGFKLQTRFKNYISTEKSQESAFDALLKGPIYNKVKLQDSPIFNKSTDDEESILLQNNVDNKKLKDPVPSTKTNHPTFLLSLCENETERRILRPLTSRKHNKLRSKVVKPKIIPVKLRRKPVPAASALNTLLANNIVDKKLSTNTNQPKYSDFSTGVVQASTSTPHIKSKRKIELTNSLTYIDDWNLSKPTLEDFNISSNNTNHKMIKKLETTEKSDSVDIYNDEKLRLSPKILLERLESPKRDNFTDDNQTQENNSYVVEYSEFESFYERQMEISGDAITKCDYIDNEDDKPVVSNKVTRRKKRKKTNLTLRTKGYNRLKKLARAKSLSKQANEPLNQNYLNGNNNSSDIKNSNRKKPEKKLNEVSEDLSKRRRSSSLCTSNNKDGLEIDKALENNLSSTRTSLNENNSQTSSKDDSTIIEKLQENIKYQSDLHNQLDLQNQSEPIESAPHEMVDTFENRMDNACENKNSSKHKQFNNSKSICVISNLKVRNSDKEIMEDVIDLTDETRLCSEISKSSNNNKTQSYIDTRQSKMQFQNNSTVTLISDDDEDIEFISDSGESLTKKTADNSQILIKKGSNLNSSLRHNTSVMFLDSNTQSKELLHSSRLSTLQYYAKFNKTVSRDSIINIENKETVKNSEMSEELILERCKQKTVLDFNLLPDVLLIEKKIGEGISGEIFFYRSNSGGCISKIIPIGGLQTINGEKQKTYNDILTEIIITMELSDLRKNPKNSTDCFIKLKHVSYVKGKYPNKLLRLWAMYDWEFGSDNDQPDMLGEEQHFIVFGLEHGGQDMEKFKFSNALQSLSVLKQIACALAVAECELEFEHRDLHWGNILISKTNEKTSRFVINGNEVIIPTYGVRPTIIDYTQSRIKYQNVVMFYDLKDEVDLFNGTGDYQMDIYRKMKTSCKNDWGKFNPRSNIFWLHYCVDKMLTMRYKNPRSKTHSVCLSVLERHKKNLHSFSSANEFVLKMVPEYRKII